MNAVAVDSIVELSLLFADPIDHIRRVALPPIVGCIKHLVGFFSVTAETIGRILAECQISVFINVGRVSMMW
jgi:hypothetical protein